MQTGRAFLERRTEYLNLNTGTSHEHSVAQCLKLESVGLAVGLLGGLLALDIPYKT
jgi:hypothetical protein